MKIGTLAWILVSMTSSTSLILMNKYIMKNYHFDWPISMTTYHFFVTYSLLEIMCRMGLIERAVCIPQSIRWKNALFNVCGIIFMNFNLKMNTIGFYQLSKLCTIPVMVVVNFVFYKKTTPLRTVSFLILLVIGIAFFSINEVSFNLPGMIIAIIAVCFTIASQTNTNIASNQYKCFGASFQHATALQMTILGLIASLALETFGNHSILSHTFHGMELILILMTGGFALLANVSAFALIGKQSAITFQVVGHAKTIIIFVFGLIFDSSPTETSDQLLKKIFGLVIAMAGTIGYTFFEMIDKQKAKQLQDESTLESSDLGVPIDESNRERDFTNLNEEEEEKGDNENAIK